MELRHIRRHAAYQLLSERMMYVQKTGTKSSGKQGTERRVQAGDMKEKDEMKDEVKEDCCVM